MYNHFRNLQERLSPKNQQINCNFPSDRFHNSKSPLTNHKLIQNPIKHNSQDRTLFNSINFNDEAQMQKTPCFLSIDSFRSRSKSPMLISIQKSPKQQGLPIKKNLANEFYLNWNKLSSEKTLKQKQLININMNDIAQALQVPQSNISKQNLKNFENIFQQLLLKYGSTQQLQKTTIKKQQQDDYENDEELKVDTQVCVNKSNFAYHFIIGKGGFGKVWKVELKKNRTLYAMKEMSKAKIIAKRSVNSVLNERNLLTQFKHPFLINMVYSFQDRENLYLVMDLLTGGDLRQHLGRQRRFNELQTKFFVSCVILALEYLHNQNVIHRDVKPENIVLDSKGYARLTDLGIARIWRPENSSDNSGTPGYMAPEVMCRQNHTIAVDYFALGVMTYEFMLGYRPYNGISRQEIKDQIISKQVQVKRTQIPNDWSLEAADFINKLIQRKQTKRLGFNGPDEIKKHIWLQGVQWNKLLNKEIQSPFIPSPIQENLEYNISIDTESQDDLIENKLLLKKNSIQNLFIGYNYDQNTKIQLKLTKSTSSTLNLN
ncbi:unnamed protein product (macronuclear) [Paramecium tetraurelia]|uniref:non-specific serine/threonine protein kinase n=1 Tax=Paramecium tetraurelia TaxID=5888 RepID=A0E2H7_PARTE|nr:uncharacterized protein GSPATT00022666001 [Paramecium tetraurelia]CAK89494.1 unnamed protein product [Paramecium tetraurelia]|eukprot:XP_001456891.1 hypothetical protein (macronuclear) [Paramecium tetraurelia strain d4-2]